MVGCGLFYYFCHPERSEGPEFVPAAAETRVPRCARNDKPAHCQIFWRSRPVRILISAMLLGCTCSLSGCYGGSRPPRIGNAALDFTIQDSDRKVSLRDFRGQVVVVNFWASWCPPCIAETPSLVRMQKRFKDKGVVVVGISADEDEAAYHAFLKKYDITFITVRDPSAKVQHLYGTVQIPDSYIIDAQGKLRRKVVNAIDWESPEIMTFLTKTAEMPR